MVITSAKPMALITPDFHRNLNTIPEAEWRQFVDKFVAYSLDGRRILAAGDSEDDVEAQLIDHGIDPSQVVVGYVDDPDVTYIDAFI